MFTIRHALSLSILTIFLCSHNVSSHNRIKPFIKKFKDLSYGAILYDCGRRIDDSIIVAYYGDIGAMYSALAPNNDHCSSFEFNKVTHILEIQPRYKQICYLKRYQGRNTWTISIHIQKENWRVTAKDELYYLTCDYTSFKHRVVHGSRTIKDHFSKEQSVVSPRVSPAEERATEGSGEIKTGPEEHGDAGADHDTETEHGENERTVSLSSVSRDLGSIKLEVEDELSNVITNIYPGQLVRLKLQKKTTNNTCQSLPTIPDHCFEETNTSVFPCEILLTNSFSRCSKVVPIEPVLESCRAYLSRCHAGCNESCPVSTTEYLCHMLSYYECQCRHHSLFISWNATSLCKKPKLEYKIGRCFLLHSNSNKTVLPGWCEKANDVMNTHTQWSSFFQLPQLISEDDYVQLQCNVHRCSDVTKCQNVCEQPKRTSATPHTPHISEVEEIEREKRATDGGSTITTSKIWISEPTKQNANVVPGKPMTQQPLTSTTTLPTSREHTTDKPGAHVGYDTNCKPRNITLPCKWSRQDYLPFYISLGVLGIIIVLCIFVIIALLCRVGIRHTHRYSTNINQGLQRQQAKRYTQQRAYPAAEGLPQQSSHNVSGSPAEMPLVAHESVAVHSPTDGGVMNPVPPTTDRSLDRPYSQYDDGLERAHLSGETVAKIPVDPVSIPRPTWTPPSAGNPPTNDAPASVSPWLLRRNDQNARVNDPSAKSKTVAYV